jgi:two-component system NtrC family sensor kinase
LTSIEGAIAVSAALGDTAVRLPWLAPSVASLVALTRPHRTAFWTTIHTDPGALLLLLRQSPHDQSPEPFRPARLAPAALRAAHEFLGQPAAGVLDVSHPAVQTVLAVGRACAQAAYALAKKSGRVDPECAEAAGLLAPLGWLAAAAVSPDAVAACFADEGLARQPDLIQHRHWDTTAAELARRLARRWELPAWLASVVGYLDLPITLATAFGAEPGLFAIVQAAVTLTIRDRANPLGMVVGTPLDEALNHLGLSPEAVTAPMLSVATDPDCAAQNPYESPLLRDLLELAAENAGRREVNLVPRLEEEVDHLHRLLLDQRSGEVDRLRRQKLAALAEFAAGAGHEINNPLAVISGQAQYLLGPEGDPERQKSLRAIVHQTQRVHQILTDLMQFSRPPKPQKQAVDVRDVAHDAVGGLAELAAHRQVRVELLTPNESCITDADPKQLQTALSCLLRNAVEAAPVSGWARLRVEITASDRLRVVVEDSGPGPIAAHAEHLFDPFFSGRPAGRGRGLGLPTAWRLAREQGGEVTFEPLPAGPTRFVLSLPRMAVLPAAPPLAA